MIESDKWKPADGLTLDPNALRAATETQHCLAITAGPGSGKTEMLAQRADFLLRTGNCPYPKRILAITFKVDASINLKERVKRRCGQDLGVRLDSYTFHAFSKRIIDCFRPVLVEKDALDIDYTIGTHKVARKQIEFADLIPLAIRILRTSTIARNAVRQTYSDVFLDEFQDCTNAQYELLKVAFFDSNIRITAVGDTKQMIMGWAGAFDGIFQTFASDFAADTLNLFQNFRSKPRLLRMQNEMIKVMDYKSSIPDEQIRGDEGKIYCLQFNNEIEEADYLARSIETWITYEKLSPSQIAILIVRQPDLYASRLIEMLEARRIAVRNEQRLQDISVEPCAQLIVDYLSIIYGRHQPKAWTRLTTRLFPFSDNDYKISQQHALQVFISEQRKLAGQSALSGQPYSDWWKFVCVFLKKVGVQTLSTLSYDYQSTQRLRDVVNETKKIILEFIEHGNLLPKALERFYDDQAIRISTIHKSKGLEFDTVIILGVEEQSFWGDAEEERCAFFVGISRAKRQLLLTTSKQRSEPMQKPRNWKIKRTPHKEFLDYAKPFLCYDE